MQRIMNKTLPAIFPAILAALAICLASGASPALGSPAAAPGPAEALPGVTPAMQSASFWTGKLAAKNRLIMDRGGIDAFNREIRRQSPSIVFDLAAYPQTLDRETLAAMLRGTRYPSRPLYAGGVPVAASLQAALREQVNLDGLRARNEVRYALAVARADLRTFPTAQGVFDSPDDDEFDLFQETIVNPAEPLLILHRSRDGRWYYVQTVNYRGWLAADAVAVVPGRDAWLAYAARADLDFLVVTAANLQVKTSDNAPPVVFEMGARIPLAGRGPSGYRIELPVRGRDGLAVFAQTVLPADSDVSVGYLPYTGENILRQAFKLQNVRYGWGGLFGGVDCSSFVMDIYRTVGIILPRNADQQRATAGIARDLRGLSPAAKATVLRSLRPGAAFFKRGHVVLYLGEDNGRGFVIHALTAYRDAASRDVPVMRVVVSAVDMLCADGKTLLEALTVARQYQND